MATTKISVRAELLKATGIEPKANETEQALAERVAEYVSEKVSDTDYAKLSKPAQAWFSACSEAADKGEPIPVLDGGAAEDKPGAASKKAAAPAKKAIASAKKAAAAPAKKAAAAAPAKKAAAAPAKKAAAAPAKKAARVAAEEPRVSVSDYVRTLICKNPKLTTEQIREKLNDAGHELADVQLVQVYRNAQRIITILRELGKLPA